MKLSRYQVDWCAYGLRKAINLSRITPGRLEPELQIVLQELDDLLDITCADESESVSAARELNVSDLVGTTATARLLECSPQWVRHIRQDLEAKPCPCGAGWLFERGTVLEYARGRRT